MPARTQISAFVSDGDDASVEVFTAEARSNLLAEISGRRIQVATVSSGPTGRTAHPASQRHLAQPGLNEFHSE